MCYIYYIKTRNDMEQTFTKDTVLRAVEMAREMYVSASETVLGLETHIEFEHTVEQILELLSSEQRLIDDARLNGLVWYEIEALAVERGVELTEVLRRRFDIWQEPTEAPDRP